MFIILFCDDIALIYLQGITGCIVRIVKLVYVARM